MRKPKDDIVETQSRTAAQKLRDKERIFNSIKQDLALGLATIREDREDGRCALFTVPLKEAVQIGEWYWNGQTLPRYGRLSR